MPVKVPSELRGTHKHTHTDTHTHAYTHSQQVRMPMKVPTELRGISGLGSGSDPKALSAGEEERLFT